MKRFDVFSLFPKMFETYFGESILKKAQERFLFDIKVHNIRDFSDDKHKVVDDYPYGGGCGMVMKVEPIYKAISKIENRSPDSKVILLSPQGERFDQEMVRRLVRYPHLIFICGRYEGVDERVKNFVDLDISLGDFIISGGELAAMVIIDAVVRMIPGVIKDSSFKEESFENSLLEYPQFTRPKNFKGYEVPSILLSGNHKEIHRWRRRESLKITWQRRPDLFSKISLSQEDFTILQEIENCLS